MGAVVATPPSGYSPDPLEIRSGGHIAALVSHLSVDSTGVVDIRDDVLAV